MTDETVSNGANHDPRGRFVRGNRAGKGNRIAQRQQELRAMIETAIVDDDLREVVGRLVALAKGGDTQAAGLLLSYAVGKPRPAPVVLELDLPALTDASSIAEALRGIVGAVAGGALDVEAGQAVAGLVTTTATAVQWADLAARVELLESKNR